MKNEALEYLRWSISAKEVADLKYYFGTPEGARVASSAVVQAECGEIGIREDLKQGTLLMPRVREIAVKYLFKLLFMWLLLLLVSYSSQVSDNSFRYSPVETVMHAVNADAQSYDLLLWTERRVPMRTSQFGDLKRLAENVGRRVGLDLDAVTRSAHTSGGTWTYAITGKVGTDLVEVTAAWISPDKVSGNNQLTSIRAKGAQSDLSVLQRRLQSSLARATGRRAEVEIHVIGRTRAQDDFWKLVSQLQRRLSRHPFTGLSISITPSATGIDGVLVGVQPGSAKKQAGLAVEGWANLPGRRQIYFSLSWEGQGRDSVVRTALSRRLEPKRALLVQRF